MSSEKKDLPPLLVDITELSKLLHRSVASLYRDDAEGRLLAGLKIGGSRRWRYDEVCEWVRAGAPDRASWEARQAIPATTAEKGGVSASGDSEVVSGGPREF